MPKEITRTAAAQATTKQGRYMYMQQAAAELIGEFPKQVLNVGVMSQHGGACRSNEARELVRL